jgi:hypothetical protein
MATPRLLSAQAETWWEAIDTTSLEGINGFLDLQLNPGGCPAGVRVQISHFSSDAVLESVHLAA